MTTILKAGEKAASNVKVKDNDSVENKQIAELTFHNLNIFYIGYARAYSEVAAVIPNMVARFCMFVLHAVESIIKKQGNDVKTFTNALINAKALVDAARVTTSIFRAPMNSSNFNNFMSQTLSQNFHDNMVREAAEFSHAQATQL